MINCEIYQNSIFLSVILITHEFSQKFKHSLHLTMPVARHFNILQCLHGWLLLCRLLHVHAIEIFLELTYRRKNAAQALKKRYLSDKTNVIITTYRIHRQSAFQHLERRRLGRAGTASEGRKWVGVGERSEVEEVWWSWEPVDQQNKD